MAKGCGDYEFWSRRIDQTVRRLASCGHEIEAGGMWSPSTDVFETSEGVVVKMELPGLAPGDLDVVLVDDRLYVRGVRRDPDAGRKIQYHQMEIPYGSFAKVVSIRMPYDREGVRAKLADGYLSLIIPRASERPVEGVAVEIKL